MMLASRTYFQYRKIPAQEACHNSEEGVYSEMIAETIFIRAGPVDDPNDDARRREDNLIMHPSEMESQEQTSSQAPGS
jgi:hypothetical protein